MNERRDFVALWERVDGHLRAALEMVQLSDATRAQVVEFLDADELGVPFECLVSSLAETGRRPGWRPPTV